MWRVRRSALIIASASTTLLVAGSVTAQTHVACVGDSITEGIGTSSAATSYPSQLQGLLGAFYAVENDGHSGATMMKSGDLPYWSVGEFGVSTSWASGGGDVVTQLGTNDSKPSNWANKAAFLADCEALVAHYRAAPKTRVWVSLVPPAFPGACCTIEPAVVANEIVPLLKTCAQDTGASTIDVFDALLPYPEYFGDGVHPNDQGAALIAPVVHDALVRMPTVALAVSPESAV